MFSGKEDAEEAPVGNGSCIEDGESLCAFARGEEVRIAIPGNAGSKLGEFVGGILAGEHVEDVFESGAGECGKRGGAANDVVEVIRGDDGLAGRLTFEAGDRQGGRMRNGGDDLLGQDVEGIAEDGSRLDEALVHGAGDGRAGDEVGAVFREDDAFAGDSHLVAGAADALHSGGDGGRRFDLDDKIDGAHVDAEFEGGSGDDGADGTGLELGLDFGALSGGEGAVVGPGEGFLRQIVDEIGEAFGGAAVVNEDERGIALANNGEEAWRDGGPDGGAFLRGVGRFGQSKIFDWNFDF